MSDDGSESSEGPQVPRTADEVIHGGLVLRKDMTQFPIEAYYSANYKKREKPIQTVHGLQNYSHVKLGDDRVFYDSSVSQECYNPIVEKEEVDYGLSEEHMKANRQRDYDYALKMTPKQDLDLIEKTMKEKLAQRTKAGPFQLRKTFKYFDRDGSGGISLNEIRYAFELMGFSFTETQITALYAQIDKELTGDLGYTEFISRLEEKDFMEVTASWLKPKHAPEDEEEQLTHEQIIKKQMEQDYDTDIAMSIATEKEETRKLFEFVNRQDTGYLDTHELQVMLMVMGIKFHLEGLKKCVDEVDPNGTGHIDFETFWSWWSEFRK